MPFNLFDIENDAVVIYFEKLQVPDCMCDFVVWEAKGILVTPILCGFKKIDKNLRFVASACVCWVCLRLTLCHSKVFLAVHEAWELSLSMDKRCFVPAQRAQQNRWGTGGSHVHVPRSEILDKADKPRILRFFDWFDDKPDFIDNHFVLQIGHL